MTDGYKRKKSPKRFAKGFGSRPANRGFEGGKKGFRKGSPSKTRKGDLDFTTKKGDRVFHRGGKDVMLKRRPFDY